MIGLMTLFFGPCIELRVAPGYFHLCPSCYEEFVAPEMERIQQRVLELHPEARRRFEEGLGEAPGKPQEAAHQPGV
jgi:hypothetical protein